LIVTGGCRCGQERSARSDLKPGRASEKPGRMAPEVAALNIGCIDGVELTRRAIRLIDKHNR
jgi:hypothetical protein